MAKLFNLARMTTATAGTGTLTLGAAVSGYLSFAAAGVANGETVTYGINDGSNSEIGEGVYTASGATLTRSVIKSTNSDSAISLSGSAEVFITPSHRHFFDQGTALLFQQTSAPTGWTKQTSHNDKALRVVSGTVGSGGSSAFSTVFGKTATDALTLTTGQIPSHNHGSAMNPGSYHVLDGYHTSSSHPLIGTGNSDPSSTSGSAGSSGSHSHGMDIRVQYVDVIIATKD
jgi:hypothetical protein